MADILEHLVRKVFIVISVDDSSLLSVHALHGRKLHWAREWCENLDRLVNHLRKIMLGYENKEAQGLLKEMEVMSSRITVRIDEHMNKIKTSLQDEEDPILVEGLEMWVGEIIWLETGEVRIDEMLKIIEKLCNIRFVSNIQGEELVVGFDHEVEILLDQLTQTSIKQFQVISIAGMAGLGKTTLARKLYNDPLIEYHFDIRAWTCVSQTYLKRDMLLGILSSFVYNLTEEIYKMSDEQLGEKLYRLLKGRRYLVVLDDIWDCMAWNDLHIYFPDDKLGSRVLFTSRDIDVTLHVGAARPAHVLRLRTADESWHIFQKKVFRTGLCFFHLKEIGMEIAEKCEGLPLAIAIAAGLVKTDLSVSWWSEISSSLRSFMVRDPSQYIDTLALSYNDLLRDLCIRKTKEENLCPETYMYAYASVPASSSTITNMPLCTISSLCYPFELASVLQVDGSVCSETYESLRILDMESVPLSLFPVSVTQLGNLRYFGIQARDGTPPASISNLVKLQMLIIVSRKSIVVPKTIWDMVNLRHLCIKTGENLIEEPCILQVTKNYGSPSGLSSLQTLSQVSPQSCHNIFSRTPYLRKLGFCGPLISSLGDMEFPNIHSLEHLRKLKLLNTIPYPSPTRSCNPLMYPENLKKLTLSNIGLDWEETWTFAWLPNLEVLKLRVDACIGELWETSDTDTVFQKLRVLKLHDLDLRQWVSSRDNFPRLQRLVVHRCLNLERIPSEIGKIPTLDMIEVSGCNNSARSSAVKIQREQEQEGNYFLKVHTTNNF